MPIPMLSPANIRAIRERRLQLSLRQLSRKMRLSWSTLHRWEKGRHKISDHHMGILLFLALTSTRPLHPCPHCGGTGIQES